MNRFSPTERIGVNFVEDFFLNQGWIPRTIYQSDVGVDMEVEIASKGLPSGQLLGIQIKSGRSYFKTITNGEVIYRVTKTHAEYWLKT